MTNEMALTGNLDQNALANIAGFVQEADATSNRPQYGSYKRASYFKGADQTEFGGSEEHWLFMFDMWTQGYTCWKEGKPVADVWKTIASGEKIDPASLPDHGPYAEGDGWSEYQSIRIVNADNGEQVDLKGTSNGFRNALRKLAGEFSDHMRRTGKVEMPVCELLSDHYKHPRYGRIDTPLFKVVEWAGKKEEDPNIVVGEIVRETPKGGKRDSVLN
jgi:hypothetical protein